MIEGGLSVLEQAGRKARVLTAYEMHISYGLKLKASSVLRRIIL